MTIGLKRGTVQVMPYDPAWVKEFEKEKQLLLDALGDKILAIEHIGSTAIPGLAAKPIIDLVAAVESFEELPVFIEGLQKLGYEYMPDRMWNNRKFFPKGSRENRTHHLSIVIKDDPEQWIKPLAFRDYMRSHEAERKQYAELKQKLAAANVENREAYTKLKEEFIESIFEKVA